jgi:hypothetical protein
MPSADTKKVGTGCFVILCDPVNPDLIILNKKFWK